MSSTTLVEAVTALALGLLFLGEGITLVKLVGVLFVIIGIIVLRS